MYVPCGRVLLGRGTVEDVDVDVVVHGVLGVLGPHFLLQRSMRIHVTLAAIRVLEHVATYVEQRQCTI